MKLIPIKEEVRIPGSNVILEAGDKLYYEEESITDLLSNRGFHGVIKIEAQTPM